MKLSYSTLRLLHECPHNYINKISKVEQPESIYLVEGKICHRILQDHVSGKKPFPQLKHINYEFPIVEEKDYDERVKFEVPYRNHIMRGYIDGLDKPVKEGPVIMLEGKFSSSPWSNRKYQDDPQRKIYGWAVRSLKQALLVTGLRDPRYWRTKKPKTTIIPFTDQDYIDAEKYMDDGIAVIKSGDFLTDLVDGKCRDPRCWWGERCMFK